jgi:hypothetical protein
MLRCAELDEDGERALPRKTKETSNLRLRVEPELLAKLEKAREKHGRTLSGEIVRRLELSFVREQMGLSSLESAATIVEVVASTLSPELPPKVAREHLQKVIDGLKRVASILRKGQEEIVEL